MRAHDTHAHAHALYDVEGYIFIIYIFSFLCSPNSEEMPFSSEGKPISSEEIAITSEEMPFSSEEINRFLSAILCKKQPFFTLLFRFFRIKSLFFGRNTHFFGRNKDNFGRNKDNFGRNSLFFGRNGHKWGRNGVFFPMKKAMPECTDTAPDYETMKKAVAYLKVDGSRLFVLA